MVIPADDLLSSTTPSWSVVLGVIKGSVVKPTIPIVRRTANQSIGFVQFASAYPSVMLCRIAVVRHLTHI